MRWNRRFWKKLRKHFKSEVIEFDCEPVRRQSKRYGILYPIIGYIVSSLAIIFTELGVFMSLFLIAGSILFLVDFFCANGIVVEYGTIHKNP
jgi:hypothetical protein